MDLRKAEKCKTIFILLDETFFLYIVTKRYSSFFNSQNATRISGDAYIYRLFIFGPIIMIMMIFFLYSYLEPNNEKSQFIHGQRLLTLLMFEVGFYTTWQDVLSVSLNVQFCSIYMLQFQLFTFCTTDINTKSITNGNGSNLSFCLSRKWSKSFDIYLQVS